MRNPIENRSNTPIKPFIKDIFSSLVFAVKLDLSKKLRVETGNDEKKGSEGSVVGVGRLLACRVISERNRAGLYQSIR